MSARRFSPMAKRQQGAVGCPSIPDIPLCRPYLLPLVAVGRYRGRLEVLFINADALLEQAAGRALISTSFMWARRGEQGPTFI